MKTFKVSVQYNNNRFSFLLLLIFFPFLYNLKPGRMKRRTAGLQRKQTDSLFFLISSGTISISRHCCYFLYVFVYKLNLPEISLFNFLFRRSRWFPAPQTRLIKWLRHTYHTVGTALPQIFGKNFKKGGRQMINTSPKPWGIKYFLIRRMSASDCVQTLCCVLS